jgi:hypothetical protein
MIPGETPDGDLPWATVKQKTSAYFGFGPEDSATMTRRPSPLRTVVGLVTFVGAGGILCAGGHAAVGAPIIGVGVVFSFQALFTNEAPPIVPDHREKVTLIDPRIGPLSRTIRASRQGRSPLTHRGGALDSPL